MFVFLKIIARFSFRSFFNTLIFYRFVFKAAMPEEIHANQELFTEIKMLRITKNASYSRENIENLFTAV